jgi:hypothetical protein
MSGSRCASAAVGAALLFTSATAMAFTSATAIALTSATAIALTSATAIAFMSATAIAQTNFNEVEPNSRKADANVVACMSSGDTITGTSTGTSTGAGVGSATSVDYFKITTCAAPAGIYAHTLTLTSTTPGNFGGMRGLTQSNGVPTAGTDSEVQTMTTDQQKWYGFGAGESVYVSVAGLNITTAAYTDTLTNTTIAPTVLGPFAPGTIQITTIGQGHTNDVELMVFTPGGGQPAGFLNDDAPSLGVQSTLTRTYAAGTYLLAVSLYNLADSRGAASDDANQGGYVLDFPGAAMEADYFGGSYDVAFAVTDANGTTPVAATRTNTLDIVWFRLVVGSGSAGAPFCVPGSASLPACVCGNPNGAGAGCSNTGSSGGVLASGGNASLAADSVDPGSVTLIGTNMLSGSTAIFLQGPIPLASGIPFGAGLRCVGGQLMRLYVKQGLVAGAKTVPEAADRSISHRTTDLFPGTPITAGSTWYYQAYYRDPTLANPGGGCPANATFNITSGQQITWAP